MIRLTLALLAACVGAVGFGILQQRAENSVAATTIVASQYQTSTNDLAATQHAIRSLQEEIQEKQKRLRQASWHPTISPEMLELLEDSKGTGQTRACTELRQELGIGWDSSPDYVLVNKSAIKQVWFDKISPYVHGGTVSKDTVQLLNLTADEQNAINAALARAREGEWLNVKSTPSSGDIVAQLTIPPPDPAFEEAQSNAFLLSVTSAIGAERANLFFPDAWREFVHDLAPRVAETMTIRQIDVDGRPDLVCEVAQGANLSTMPVRYANYPAFPVLKLFPGGWQAMAQELGFRLPPSFMPPGNQQ